MVDAVPIRIHLFASLRIAANGAPHRFAAPPKTLPLLAYLLLHRDRAVARASIAFALWPDEPENAARAKLRRHLYYLNAALPDCGARWMESDKRFVRWNTDVRLFVDVIEFERLASVPGASQRESAALYAGDLLDGLDEECLVSERDRLRSLQVTKLESLLAESVERRVDAAIIADAKRLLAFDPWREDALRALVLARARAGDRVGALTDYRRFAARLVAEIGIEPMPETVACARDLQR